MSQASRGGLLVSAVAGAALMFAGWVLAVVPAFHQIQRVALILGIAIVALGLVVIPPAIDIFFRAPEPGKRGAGAVIVSMIPSAGLFLITVAVLPLSMLFRVLAIACELAGMALYGWAWWSYHEGGKAGSGEVGHRQHA